jgi:hypothetical protein
MSKTETTATIEPTTFKRTYTGFDENLKSVEKEVEVSFTPVTTNENALVELNRINNFVDAANYLIRREALAKAKESAGISGGFDRETVMNFIKPWREMPMFSAMVKAEDKRKATAEEWNAQTEAILEQIRQIPVLLQQLKDASAKAIASQE